MFRTLKLYRALHKIKGSPPCLLPFEVYDMNDRRGMGTLPILDGWTFCSLCKIPALVQAGVTGFKIVGRCLDEDWNESVTGAYRELLNFFGSGQMTSSGFQKKIDSLKKKALFPWNPHICKEKRCYYAPLFTASYKFAAPQS